MPIISVVMPVYNGAKYLRESIESILRQSFKNFEFIIINDGSVDDTEKIIKSFGEERIVYIKNTANRGLSASFNIGIRLARGKYIARMDADDVSLNERFGKQLEFLENHHDIDIVGSAAKIIDGRGVTRGTLKKAKKHIEIKWSSLFSNPVFHPTIMARAAVLKNNPFDETLPNSEDYELWSRLIFTKSVRFENLPDILLLYRSYPESTTQKNDLEKKARSAQNSINNIERYIKLSEEEKTLVIELRQGQVLSMQQLKMIFKLYFRAAKAFSYKEKLKFPKSIPIFTKLLTLLWSLSKYKLRS